LIPPSQPSGFGTAGIFALSLGRTFCSFFLRFIHGYGSFGSPFASAGFFPKFERREPYLQKHLILNPFRAKLGLLQHLFFARFCSPAAEDWLTRFSGLWTLPFPLFFNRSRSFFFLNLSFSLLVW